MSYEHKFKKKNVRKDKANKTDHFKPENNGRCSHLTPKFSLWQQNSCRSGIRVMDRWSMAVLSAGHPASFMMAAYEKRYSELISMKAGPSQVFCHPWRLHTCEGTEAPTPCSSFQQHLSVSWDLFKSLRCSSNCPTTSIVCPSPPIQSRVGDLSLIKARCQPARPSVASTTSSLRQEFSLQWHAAQLEQEGVSRKGKREKRGRKTNICYNKDRYLDKEELKIWIFICAKRVELMMRSVLSALVWKEMFEEGQVPEDRSLFCTI